MGKFLSPPSLDNVKTRCAIIFYPDDGAAFFSSALRGQLSELCRPYIWEGDREFTRAISELWIQTDLLTDDVFWRTDCELVGLITGEESMNINVNVTCGCCNSQPADTLICYDRNGNPILPPESEPIEQNSPVGGDWPMQPVEDAPPADFDTWDDYDTNACAAANAYYKLVVWILSAVYGIFNLAESAAQVILALAAWFPAQVAEVLSSRFLANMAEALLSLAEKSEDAQDWIGTSLEYLEENQQHLVCLLYSNRHDIPAMRLSFIGDILEYVVNTLTLSGLGEEHLRNFLLTTAPTNVLFAWFVNAGVYADLVAEPIDCSLCAGGHAWTSNVGNGDGDFSVKLQGYDYVAANGLMPTLGTLTVISFVSITQGWEPVGADAVSFFASRLGVGNLNTKPYTMKINTTNGRHTVYDFSDEIWVNESVLIHNSDYAGPTAGYDRVIALATVDEFTIPPSGDTENSNLRFLGMEIGDVTQPQNNCYIELSQIAFLDNAGEPIA